MKNDHEGGVYLPRSQDDWRLPPTPLPLYPHLNQEKGLVSQGKSRLLGAGEDGRLRGSREEPKVTQRSSSPGK